MLKISASVLREDPDRCDFPHIRLRFRWDFPKREAWDFSGGLARRLLCARMRIVLGFIGIVSPAADLTHLAESFVFQNREFLLLLAEIVDDLRRRFG